MIWKSFENSNFRSLLYFILVMLGVFIFVYIFSMAAFADGVRLPGEDASSKMEAAGTLMHFIDSSLFHWAARILAGICIFAAGWNLKEMRFGPALISVISAILFGTAPTWVRNIFSLGGSDSVFSSNPIEPHHVAHSRTTNESEDSENA